MIENIDIFLREHADGNYNKKSRIRTSLAIKT